MPKITRLGWTAYLIAVAAIVLDQISKAWILSTLGTLPGASQPLVGPLHLTLVQNFGMSFGLLRGMSWLLVLFSAAVVIGLSVWVRKTTKPLMAAGIGMIIGGAFGNNLIDRIRYSGTFSNNPIDGMRCSGAFGHNLIDRVRCGYVVDFIDVSRLHFPWVFNVADSAITVGVCLLLLDSFLSEEKKIAHPDGHGL